MLQLEFRLDAAIGTAGRAFQGRVADGDMGDLASIAVFSAEQASVADDADAGALGDVQAYDIVQLMDGMHGDRLEVAGIVHISRQAKAA